MAVIFLFAVFFISPALSDAADYPGEVLDAKRSIKGSMLVSHIDFLASKYCRGREPGDFGMKVADKYITSVLKGAGVQSAGEMGTYFQPVKLKTVALSDRIHLKVEERTGGTTSIQNTKPEWDFLPTIISAEKSVTAPVVFAGYGITAPEHNYDDYKAIDARGKIVLVMRHEPGENDDSSPFDGRKISTHGTLLTKIRNAQKHGAAGVLFVTDPLNHDDLSLEGGFMSGTMWSSLAEKRAKNNKDFKYMNFKPRMRIEGDDFGVKIPALHIHGKLAENILGGNHSLLKIQKEIDKNKKPRSFTLPGKRISMGVYFKTEPVNAHNVVAKVVGSDPILRDEVVIVGAHYDHLGKNKRGQVFGGADDNASGSAVVLELARAFQRLENKPKRTILFILFTAEEKGLLGARYYVYNPLFPLEKTIAMINLDMVGRNSADQLSLVGKYQFPKLFNIVNEANKKSVNFELNFSVEEFIRNSDHFPFMRENIPAVFFSCGSHDDYHTPRDTVGRIVTEKVEKAAHLAFLSLWEAANLPAGTRLDTKK
ncbi:MAG: M20/M25/M40 family metallo-hydrolase [bacterium]|nr:M20/M25/M40 family metallo-hydrolase [bacterium]